MEPRNVTLYRNRVFANVIKGLKMGEIISIIRVGPKFSHMYTFKRETGRFDQILYRTK